MKTSSEKYDKRIEELEDKIRALELENKNNTWSSGKIFKFITLGSVTVVGAGVILQQQTQLESQKEAITFLFDKLKEIELLKYKIELVNNNVHEIVTQFNQHDHRYGSIHDHCGTNKVCNTLKPDLQMSK